VTKPSQGDEAVIWAAYPSWGQFAWLYFISLAAALRGVMFYAFGVPAGDAWVGGAAALLACAAFVRHWAWYAITSKRLVVTNGYTRREINAVALDEIGEIDVNQGPIATVLGIGTLKVFTKSGGRVLRFRGVRDPESLKNRILAVAAGPPVAAEG